VALFLFQRLGSGGVLAARHAFLQKHPRVFIAIDEDLQRSFSVQTCSFPAHYLPNALPSQNPPGANALRTRGDIAAPVNVRSSS